MIAKNLFDIVYNTALINLSEDLGTTMTGTSPANPVRPNTQPVNVSPNSSNFNTIAQTISSLSPEEVKRVQTMLNTPPQAPTGTSTGNNIQKPTPGTSSSTVTPSVTSSTTPRV